MIAADFLADPCRLTLFCAGSAAYGAPIVHSPAPAPVRPTSQYVRLFSGLRRSTSREYLVLLADDQMPERDDGTAVYGEGHSRPAQPFQAQYRGWARTRPGRTSRWIRCGASSVCIAYRHMPEC